MPVIPPGIPPFTIRPPLTMGDKGEPSDSILADALRILDLIEDERHLTAQDLYHSVRARVQEWSTHKKDQSERQRQQQIQDESSSITSGSVVRKTSLRLALPSARRARQKESEEAAKLAAEEAAKDKEYEEAKRLLEENRDKFDVLENRCRLFRKAQKNLQEDDEWILASHLFGIETYYRREPDGTLSLKLQGEMTDLPLFEQVCVLKEVDLHYKWAPFCSSSMTVADLGKLDTVGWFMIGLSSFGLARDGCFRAIGCDNITEDGTIILAGQGIQDVPEGAPQPLETFLCHDPIIEKLDIPPRPTRRGAARMTIHTFDAITHITSPTSATTKLVANMDPNISFLPQSLLEFIMKHLAGVLLAKLQTAAKNVVKNPIHNEHAQKMRQETAFYKDWLMPKFQSICELKGWEMPPVNALELSEEQLTKENRKSDFRKSRRAVTFSDSDEIPVVSQRRLLKEQDPDTIGDGFDDDGVSDLTSQSERSHRAFSNGGPFRTFMQSRELQKSKKKQEEIRQVRAIAAQRMQPKERPPSKVERLEQLRDAKARRTGGDDSAPDGMRSDVSTVVSRDSTIAGPKSFSETVTDRLQSHSRKRRFLVMSLVLTLFLSLLHPELLEFFIHADDLPRWMAFQRGNYKLIWWVRMLQGLGLLIYLLLCAILHFATCDIALVYAFLALDLASKSGRQVKKYYSDNVRGVVALMSFGIYALSVIKALLHVAFSMYVAGSSAMYQNLSECFSSLSVQLLGITSEEANILPYLQKVPGFAYAIAVTRQLFEATANYASKWSDGNVMGVEEALNSWQPDAFDTARLLYLYTGIPLLIFLILFNYSMRQRKTAPKKPKDVLDTTADTAPIELTINTEPKRATSDEQVIPGTDQESSSFVTDPSSQNSQRRRFLRLPKGSTSSPKRTRRRMPFMRKGRSDLGVVHEQQSADLVDERARTATM